jgi:mxaJ protein
MKAAPNRSAAALSAAAVVLGLLTLGRPGQSDAQDHTGATLRVCADPNNLPFSNVRGEGFENKLADLVATDLGEGVSYDWWPQRRSYVRHGLKEGACDVIMGVPALLDTVSASRPYYRSTYVFVSRADRGYGDLTSIKDPRLKQLSIGVQLIGNDGYNTPPAHALSEQGIIANLVGYSVYGDYSEANPPARIIEAVERGEIEIAAAWGPLAGFFARRSPVPLTVTPITGTADFKPLLFQYDIAVGLRKGDTALQSRIDNVLVRRQPEIARLLSDFGVPVVSEPPPQQAQNGGLN